MKATGDRGEALAIAHLKKKGYRIVERNYRSPVGEIDIIAEHRGTVVFVEVKARTPSTYGLPEEAVNRRKQQRIARAALLYLSRLKEEPPARFDIISVHMLGPKAEIEHIENAFTL